MNPLGVLLHILCYYVILDSIISNDRVRIWVMCDMRVRFYICLAHNHKQRTWDARWALDFHGWKDEFDYGDVILDDYDILSDPGVVTLTSQMFQENRIGDGLVFRNRNRD